MALKIASIDFTNGSKKIKINFENGHFAFRLNVRFADVINNSCTFDLGIVDARTHAHMHGTHLLPPLTQ